MVILFKNARILTMKIDDPIFIGNIIVEDDLIKYIGDNVPEYLIPDREIDCNGNLLMPGFKNAHTHSGMTLLRSLADDLPLDKWLNEAIFPIEAKMTPEDIKIATKLAVLEYLTSGITACFDMYLTPQSIAEAMEECGFRCVQVGALNNFSQSVELEEKLYNELNSENSLNSYIFGLHAEYTTDINLLKDVSRLANKYKAPVYMHLSETKSEVDGCIERYNMTPMELMDSIGMFNYGGGIYHGVYMNANELDIMKARNLYVVTNPSSNLKLASGIAPIKDYLDKGIPVAIGTDGPASNNCLDMFREMFLVSALSKFRENDAAQTDALDVLRMATVNGAHAMGLNDCDVLDVGKKADIIMIDLNMPNMQPVNNIEKNIVYSGSKINIKMTMINGRILYMDSHFYINEDVIDIYRKTEVIKNRLING